MSKIRLSGSNSGYVEIAAAADAGNLTFNMPTTGTALFGNGNNVISGITTFNAALDINSTVDVSGTSVFNNDVTFDGATSGYDVVWDRSDNALEFAANTKATFGNSQDMQLFHDGNHGYINDAGVGNLRLRSGTLEIQNLAGSKTSAVFSSGGGQTLNFNDSAKFVTTNTGVVVTGICTATSFSGDGSDLTGLSTPLSFRNLIINGAMRVAQRGASSNSAGYQTVDRFLTQIQSGTLTQSQQDLSTSDTPYTLGFRKYMRILNQSGIGAATNQYAQIDYKVEAQDLANSGWNYTSNTSKITLSFWVRASVTAKYFGWLITNDGTQRNHPFVISDSNGSGTNLTANTWTKITKTFTGFSGITINNDNGIGWQITFAAYYGTDWTNNSVSTTSWNTFTSGGYSPDFPSTTWATTTNATFDITGVQLEVGDQATTFEHRSFNDEFLRCARYFYKQSGVSVEMLLSRTGGRRVANVYFPVPMRATPNVSIITAFFDGGASISASSASIHHFKAIQNSSSASGAAPNFSEWSANSEL